MKITIVSLSLLSTAAAFVSQPKTSTPFGGKTSLNSFDQGMAPPQGARLRDNFRGSSRDRISSPTFRSDALDTRTSEEIWATLNSVPVQGSSLRTCSFAENVERVEVYMRTEGRPLNADVQLWQGPDNTPQKMQVYLEDGSMRPFRTVVECPGDSNAISIRNTGELEFPLAAGVEPLYTADAPARVLDSLAPSRIVQGGAVYTTPFAPSVTAVQIMLKSDGRPLNARIELLQGPNNNKQVMEVYSEDGDERPFYIVIDTPGVGNVVRIVNTATVEFPLFAVLEPYTVDDSIMDERDGQGMIWS